MKKNSESKLGLEIIYTERADEEREERRGIARKGRRGGVARRGCM